jgi:hypothetical protein
VITLVACDRVFAVHCGDCETAGLIKAVFGRLVAPDISSAASRRYRIERLDDVTFTVSDGSDVVNVRGPDSLLLHIDQELILALQYLRPDLFFVHAAVLGWRGRAVVVAAPSGTGKSTLAYASVMCGLDYLSDELAPIELPSLTVRRYPRAVCLKANHPFSNTLPRAALCAGDRIYVPVESLTDAVTPDSVTLGACIFLRRERRQSLRLHRISAASAAARLLENALNSLSHAESGLQPAAMLGTHLPCFELEAGDAAETAAAIRSLLA